MLTYFKKTLQVYRQYDLHLVKALWFFLKCLFCSLFLFSVANVKITYSRHSNVNKKVMFSHYDTIDTVPKISRIVRTPCVSLNWCCYRASLPLSLNRKSKDGNFLLVPNMSCSMQVAYTGLEFCCALSKSIIHYRRKKPITTWRFYLYPGCGDALKS